MTAWRWREPDIIMIAGPNKLLEQVYFDLFPDPPPEDLPCHRPRCDVMDEDGTPRLGLARTIAEK